MRENYSSYGNLADYTPFSSVTKPLAMVSLFDPYTISTSSCIPGISPLPRISREPEEDSGTTPLRSRNIP